MTLNLPVACVWNFLNLNGIMSRKASRCVILILLAWAQSAGAETVVLFPSKTNTLIQVSGTDVQPLSNGRGDIYVGRTNQDGQGPATISIRRGLIAFDIADNAPAGTTITGVTLNVDDVRGFNGNQTVSLYEMYRDWGQGTSYFDGGQGAAATNGDATWFDTFYDAANPAASPTWSAPGGEAGVDFNATASAAALIIADNTSNTFSWSSTASPAMLSDVQQWLESPATNFGWIILGNESAGQTAKRFGGQYAVAPETPPQLTVQYAPTWIWTGGSGNGGWTTPGNWASGTGFPGSGAAIVLGSAQTTGGTVDLLSAGPIVSHLVFEGSHTIKVMSTAIGGGQLTLDNGSFPAAIIVSGSGNAIDATVAITLNSDAWIMTSGSSDSLSIAGDIGNGTAAHGMTKDGPGILVLSGSNSYTGGTNVDAGTLIAVSGTALPDGTSLTVGAGGTFIFDPSAAGSPVSNSAAAVAVPDPGTLALLIAGAALLVMYRKLR